MKKLFIAALSLLFLTTGTLTAETHYKLKVDGLVCPFCEYNIEKKVSKLDGISSVKANLKYGTVTLTVADGTPLPEADIHKAITDAGFTLKSITKHQ